MVALLPAAQDAAIGLADAVGPLGVLCVTLEAALAKIERRYPRSALLDDEIRIPTAFLGAWRARVTTVFAWQGPFALGAQLMGPNPAADLTIERIGGLLPATIPT